jgi:hypothetical protein
VSDLPRLAEEGHANGRVAVARETRGSNAIFRSSAEIERGVIIDDKRGLQGTAGRSIASGLFCRASVSA